MWSAPEQYLPRITARRPRLGARAWLSDVPVLLFRDDNSQWLLAVLRAKLLFEPAHVLIERLEANLSA